jgi:N-glycosylase/DNA lyase
MNQKDLVQKINKLKKSKPLKQIVSQRIKEFQNTKDWFSELCFCIMTANARADKAIEMQRTTDFCALPQQQLAKRFRGKIRFHKNKASYICQARKFRDIKQILAGRSEHEAREWLVKNIKGIGMKESSHFLRNTGSTNVAILDRHILSLLKQYKILNKIPPLTKKNYLAIEKKMLRIAKASNLSVAELDLYLWFLKTGKVLK